MAAGQRDIPVLLQPGSGATVRAPGEFMYLAFADREILAIVTGQDGTQSRLKMVTGDFTKPAGGIEEVELVNPDPDNACAVTVIIGAGEFDRKIIQGEVTITPGIRGADGQFVDDTRSTVRLRVALGNITPQSYIAAEKISSVSSVAGKVFGLDDGRVIVESFTVQENNWRLYESADSPAYTEIPRLGDVGGAQVGPEIWVAQKQDLPILGWRAVINRYDAATLIKRGEIVTGVAMSQLPGDSLTSMTAADGAVYLARNTNRELYKLALDGSVIAKIDGTQDAQSLIVNDGKLHIFDNYFYQIFSVYDLALNKLSNSESAIPAIGGNFRGMGIGPKGRALGISYGSNLEQFSLEDITISASGSVTSCAGGGFLKSSPIDTKAEIYTQRLDDGRVLMSGEILRAALEIYTGRYMPANYLDYVYRVRAENLNGISPRTVDSGGKSFLAAGIPDDASGTFPQTLEITLREGLL